MNVVTYNPQGGIDQDLGDYELFLYSFALGDSQAKGVSLYGGSGHDTVIGDSTNAVVKATMR